MNGLAEFFRSHEQDVVWKIMSSNSYKLVEQTNFFSENHYRDIRRIGSIENGYKVYDQTWIQIKQKNAN